MLGGGDPQRLVRVGCFQHRVAVRLESQHGQTSNAWLVFDHEHRLRTVGRSRCLGRLCDEPRRRRALRQQDRDRRPLTDLADHPYVTVALLDDAVAGGEAQARAASLRLRGEERLKQVRLNLLGHASAGV